MKRIIKFDTINMSINDPKYEKIVDVWDCAIIFAITIILTTIYICLDYLSKDVGALFMLLIIMVAYLIREIVEAK